MPSPSPRPSHRREREQKAFSQGGLERCHVSLSLLLAVVLLRAFGWGVLGLVERERGTTMMALAAMPALVTPRLWRARGQ